MKYIQKTEENVIVAMIESDTAPAADINGVWVEVEDGDIITINGKMYYKTAPEDAWPRRSITESIEQIEALIQQRLDDFAQTLTYGNMLSACTYATSTNPVFAKEGQYCVEARDATWDAAYGILNAMMAEISGTGKEGFTEAELAALWADIETKLPPLAWPEGSRGHNG